MRSGKARNKRGQVFVEVLCGMFILIPIALFGLDLIVLILGNSANDSLAKNCARAAANAQSSAKAQAAAEQVISHFPASSLIEKVELQNVNFDSKENVTVESEITVRIPITLPGTKTKVAFKARATEPVVGVSAAPI